jgi:hypothetical protein
MGSPRLSPRIKLVFAAACLIQLVFILSLPLGFLNPLFVEAMETYGQGSDFFGIYQAGSNLLKGYSIYDYVNYRNEAPQVVPFYYFFRYLPPTAYGAAVATLLFSPGTAYWVWIVLNEVLLLLVVLSILRAGDWPRGRRWTAAALWLGFFPFYIEQFMGQFSFLMAVLLWILWRHEAPPPGDEAGSARWGRFGLGNLLDRWRSYAWGKDRPGPASVLLTWSASLTVKSFTALLALPFLRDLRLKRVLAGGILAAAACIPYYIYRPADLIEFARLNFSPFPPIYKASMGFRTMTRDILSQAFPDPPQILGRGLDLWLVAAFSGVIFLFAVWATLRMRRTAWERNRRAAFDLLLWVAVFFLTYKSVWEYHYVMMLPAVTAAYLVTGSRVVLALGILLGLPTLYALTPLLAGVPSGVKLHEWPGWYRMLHFSVKVLPTLGLFVWSLRVGNHGPGGSLSTPGWTRGGSPAEA